jgi:hypothetical protein
MGKQVISMADVKSISDPKLAAQAEQMVAAKSKPHGPEKVQVKPQEKSSGAEHANLSQGNINDVAMDQGMINRLNKAGAKAGM